MKTLSGILGVPTIYYGASDGSGLDSEGRVVKVTAGSGTNPVTAVTYSSGTATATLGALTGVTFGSADNDSFTYDPSTGRMATYTFAVNNKTDIGTLTWNATGTLKKVVIANQIPNTNDSQTCNYLYDDLARVSTANCGALWAQNFAYDPFGNIRKSGNSSFLPIYSPTQNQFTSIPGITTPYYDQNGNLIKDNLNTYTWDPNWGNMLKVSVGSTTVTATYDALGRMVENNAGGTYTEFIYGPTGSRVASANGQTLLKAFITLPGGAMAIYNSSGLAYYRHSDWLGSSRLTSTVTPPTAAYSTSGYAPFGEQYATSGTTDASFTGQDQSTGGSLYDFLARRYSPSQGRWISPDPTGGGAVRKGNPQSWNRYAYVMNNPLSLIDPLGLEPSGCAFYAYVHDPGDEDEGSGHWEGMFCGGDDTDPGRATSQGQCKEDDLLCKQIERAKQNAINALNNSECAKAVDDGSPRAAATLGADNGADSLATITTGDLGSGTMIDGQSYSPAITTLGTFVNYQGLQTHVMGPPVVMTVNSNSTGFMDATLLNGGYSVQLSQAIFMLHDLGHAADMNFLHSAIVDDSVEATGSFKASAEASVKNSDVIAGACFPQGDFGAANGGTTVAAAVGGRKGLIEAIAGFDTARIKSRKAVSKLQCQRYATDRSE